MPDLTQILTTQNIIEGGAVLIALSLVWIVYKLITNHDNHLQKVVDRNSDAWNANTQALTKLSTTLELTHEKKEKVRH